MDFRNGFSLLRKHRELTVKYYGFDSKMCEISIKTKGQRRIFILTQHETMYLKERLEGFLCSDIDKEEDYSALVDYKEGE